MLLEQGASLSQPQHHLHLTDRSQCRASDAGRKPHCPHPSPPQRRDLESPVVPAWLSRPARGARTGIQRISSPWMPAPSGASPPDSLFYAPLEFPGSPVTRAPARPKRARDSPAGPQLNRATLKPAVFRLFVVPATGPTTERRKGQAILQSDAGRAEKEKNVSALMPSRGGRETKPPTVHVLETTKDEEKESHTHPQTSGWWSPEGVKVTGA